MGISLDDYRSLRADAVSIQYGGDDNEGGTSPAELVPDEETPLTLIERRDESRKLADMLRKLPEREAMIMALHYQEGLTFREVAKVLDLTPGRISQMHTQAILRLRAMAREEGMES
jgi:RNA polymerase sigma factor for flagellar operon FliA